MTEISGSFELSLQIFDILSAPMMQALSFPSVPVMVDCIFVEGTVANASFVLRSWEANWSESCLHPLTCDWQFESSHPVMVSSLKHAGFNGFSNDTTFLHSWASDTFTHEHVSDQTTTIHLCVVEGKNISEPLQLWLDKNLCPWCRFD